MITSTVEKSGMKRAMGARTEQERKVAAGRSRVIDCYWKEQNFKACYEKQELSKIVEKAKKVIEDIIRAQRLCVLCGNTECKNAETRGAAECKPVLK